MKVILMGFMMAGVMSAPLMALNVTNSDITDRHICITFDQQLAATGEASGFEVADRRYGRFISATATIVGNTVTLQYESYAPVAEQQAHVVWRYVGEPNKLSNEATGSLQSYEGDIRFKAVPLGAYPVVGKIRIACVGDSITHGFGINDVKKRYPETLGQLLGEPFEVGRFGNSGKTAGKCRPGQWFGEQKEFKQSLEFKADLYICNLGINDTGQHLWNPTVSERDFSTLIKEFQGQHSATVVLWGKLGPDFRGEPGKKAFPGNVFEGYSFRPYDSGTALNRPIMEAIIAKLAAKHNCPTIDAYTEMAQNPEFYKVDGLHPTPEGATKLAELTYNWLAIPYQLPPTKNKP